MWQKMAYEATFRNAQNYPQNPFNKNASSSKKDFNFVGTADSYSKKNSKKTFRKYLSYLANTELQNHLKKLNLFVNHKIFFF